MTETKNKQAGWQLTSQLWGRGWGRGPLYLRQALHMMKEEKLFSGIYIAGTALAIAFTMVMAIVYYVKLAKIYPEVNRDKMVYIDNFCFMYKEGRVNMTCNFSDYAFEK